MGKGTRTSVKGILAAINWPDRGIQDQMTELALKSLMKNYDAYGNKTVDVFWHEISGDNLIEIEAMAEDLDHPCQQLAALVASKVHFHLGSFEKSKMYALGAGASFDTNDDSEYTNCILAQCIDYYTEQRSKKELTDLQLRDQIKFSPTHEEYDHDEAIVNIIFDRCLKQGQYRHCMGLAIEAKRMDYFERSILESSDKKGMLSYAFQIVMKLIENRTYRNQLIWKLYEVYKGDYEDSNSSISSSAEKAIPEWLQMVQCLIYLDDPDTVAGVLEHLIKTDLSTAAISYNIAFELYESATQQFLRRVIDALRKTAPIPKAKVKEVITTAESNIANSTSSVEKTDSSNEINENMSDEEKSHKYRLDKLLGILSGSETIRLHQKFLCRNDHTDTEILKHTKDVVRDSISHTATVISHGFMNCGTTHDHFLRSNIDWLSRSTNWAKFSCSASLGVLHRGHEDNAHKTLSSYLPKPNTDGGFGYAEGGGLLAMGLIHANHGEKITEYLTDQLKTEGSASETLKSGGCLGLGAAAMGTKRADIYELLKTHLYMDDAVIGEAAALAIGLVELGSGNATALSDLVAYAHETQHEKIIRGIAVGLALIMYGRLEDADALIDALCNEKDSILRRAGMYTIAMAYCGTGSNTALRKLLHVAVSDVKDDVRRAAVTSLGFLLFKTPEKCPGLVSLLTESYNPSVRYGSAMALGIACAGTGSKEAISLIEPMVRNDKDSLVRQGALIASAMILIRNSEISSPKAKEFRALYPKIIADKHENSMSRLGAILAQGIMDAGGRNSTINLQTRAGHNNMSAVVGMLVFTQYWYWFPLSHFLSLSFTPSCLIKQKDFPQGTSEADREKVEFSAKPYPIDYKYPPPIATKKAKDKSKVATAVLSTTARHKRRDADKSGKKEDEGEEPGPPEPFEYKE